VHRPSSRADVTKQGRAWRTLEYLDWGSTFFSSDETHLYVAARQGILKLLK
jgi:hypothetical protein